MNWKVPLADLDYGPEEEQAVLNVLKSKWLTMGEVTEQFERNFAIALNTKYAIAVSNATEALHMACLALGIGPGDEVIVPSLSFVATANAVLYTGADVVFARYHLAAKPDHLPAGHHQKGHPQNQGHHRDALRRIPLRHAADLPFCPREQHLRD